MNISQYCPQSFTAFAFRARVILYNVGTVQGFRTEPSRCLTLSLLFHLAVVLEVQPQYPDSATVRHDQEAAAPATAADPAAELLKHRLR